MGIVVMALATINVSYGKCSKKLNTFRFLVSKKYGFSAFDFPKYVRIANREDHDQTASSEVVWSGSALFV